MTDVLYTDQELRMKALPLAVELVNTEVQRILGRCNTAGILELTNELVNIIKYNAVKAPDAEPEVVIDSIPPAPVFQ